MIELKFDEISLNFLKVAEKTNKSIFLTWKAGAWKSSLVNYFISKTSKKFVLLWTTWISAINIWWQTIHKFFWINTKSPINKMKSESINIFRKTDILIIDEVSMLRADLFDYLDRLCKKLMQNDLFLWWKQFIFVWDLFQLPAVPEQDEKLKEYYNKNYKWLFFFNWNSFDKENFEKIELKKVYRQDDQQFINILNRVRIWENSKDILDYFNSRIIESDLVNPKAILIWTTNKIVDIKNSLELSKLPWYELVSIWLIQWEYPDEILPVDKVLKVKVWARIMFIVNEKYWDYVNWTLWTILEVYKNNWWYLDKCKIETDDWKILEISKNMWVNSPWDDEYWNQIIDWTYLQFPFKLAFAITIHKVQWKSFDHVIIDLWWWAFAEWQVYVALSRCRSFEWLQLLKAIKQKDIKVSHAVIKFLKHN